MSDFIIIVLIQLSIIYTIYRIIRFLYNYLLDFILYRRLNKGSSEYLEFKSKLESCIESGEINSYFEGFQFIKVDNSNDSDDMSYLQSRTDPLTKYEKRKLMLFGKKLLSNL